MNPIVIADYIGSDYEKVIVNVVIYPTFICSVLGNKKNVSISTNTPILLNEEITTQGTFGKGTVICYAGCKFFFTPNVCKIVQENTAQFFLRKGSLVKIGEFEVKTDDGYRVRIDKGVFFGLAKGTILWLDSEHSVTLNQETLVSLEN